MKIGPVDLDREVLIVAEIGNNHEGNVALAEQMIGLAADAGAQAVKFQTIAPEHLVALSEKDRLRQLRRFALSRADHERLADAAAKAGVLFLSTPFFLDAVDWLSPLVAAFKVASGDNDFAPLLEAVAATEKPLIVSTGMLDFDGARDAKTIVDEVWNARNVNPGIVLLHCVSAYPTPIEEANLSAIHELVPLCDAVGYSDHTLGIDAAVLAVALGARVIEKHFTISKDHSQFRDHQLSADPDELAALVERVRAAEVMLGGGGKRLLESEAATAGAARRSIVAGRDLAEGIRLTLADLDWLRPAGGISPMQTKRFLGRSLTRAVKQGERITPDLLD